MIDYNRLFLLLLVNIKSKHDAHQKKSQLLMQSNKWIYSKNELFLLQLIIELKWL